MIRTASEIYEAGCQRVCILPSAVFNSWSA